MDKDTKGRPRNGLLTTKQAEYQAPGKCGIFSLFCCLEMCIRDRYLCFVGQGCECGGFKEEIGKPDKADHLFRLMDINGVCHIVFCGRLEACFRVQTVEIGRAHV